jgi:hypothetical protein
MKIIILDAHIIKLRRKMSESGGGYSMVQGVIHKCTRECPWNKKCFVCKTAKEVEEDVIVLHKCKVTKEDIPIHLGKTRKELLK